jgi:hypothetical protein
MEISDQTTCLDPYFASFEESLSSRNYKPETLTNYRYLLRRFGRLLDIEGIAPSALTPDLAVALGRRLPTTPKSQIKVPNLAKLFVAHLIEIGVATRPPLTPAQAERAELLSNFETYLLRRLAMLEAVLVRPSSHSRCRHRDSGSPPAHSVFGGGESRSLTRKHVMGRHALPSLLSPEMSLSEYD